VDLLRDRPCLVGSQAVDQTELTGGRMEQELETNKEIALVRIAPQADQAVLALHDQAIRLAEHAQALVITSDDDVKASTNDLSLISGLKKALKTEQDKWIRPIRQHLDNVRDIFKAFIAPLEEADTITRGKILAYRAKQDRKHREAEEINRLRMEAAQKEMGLKGELTESVSPVEVAPVPPDHYRGELGTLGKAMIPKWEVKDFARVPDEYKIIDAAKVGKLVRAGLRSIPGIHIWEEESLRVTTRREADGRHHAI